MINQRQRMIVLDPRQCGMKGPGHRADCTLLDTFTTPVLFELFGERALTQVMTTDARLAYETF